MKYRAYATVTGSKYIGEFEAESKEQAEELAWRSDKADVYLCWQCEDECEDAQVTNIVVEEVKRND